MLAPTPQKPRILLVDPFFGSLGGGVMVSCWIAEALRQHADLTWLTWRGLDHAKLNRFAGTELDPQSVRTRAAHPVARALGETLNRVDKDPYSTQRWAILMRQARRMAKDFDLVIGCNDEVDFGAPCIQYIHYPYMHRAMERRGAHLELKRAVRYRPWRVISGFQAHRFAQNLTLVNSDWTGRKLQKFYGLGSRTVHPPVPGHFDVKPWDARDNAAICVGRIAGDKRIDQIIATVRKVREAVPDFRLVIAGVPYGGPGGDDGMAFVQAAAARHDWIDLHLNLPRAELCTLISRARIGIHAKEDEHFGISVAELVKAGAIVFVHDSGGQVEIVKNDERLTYTTATEAADKIIAVLRDSDLRDAVATRLAAHRDQLGTEAFCDTIREIAFQALHLETPIP